MDALLSQQLTGKCYKVHVITAHSDKSILREKESKYIYQYSIRSEIPNKLATN